MFWLITYISGVVCSFLLLRNQYNKHNPNKVYNLYEAVFALFITLLSWYGVCITLMAAIAGRNDEDSDDIE